MLHLLTELKNFYDTSAYVRVAVHGGAFVSAAVVGLKSTLNAVEECIKSYHRIKKLLKKK